MKRLLRAVFTSGIVLCAAAVLSAQASRTWVSGVGDDANPCSRTAPCKTFAGAISKTAAGGEIDALDPGGFGAVTITKAITIDGGGGIVASVLSAGTNGIIIQAGSTDAVALRNLQINGVGVSPGTDLRGIKFNSGASLVIDRCDVSGVGNFGVSIQSSTPGATVSIINSTMHGNHGNGIAITPPSGVTNRVTLDHVRSVNNGGFGLASTAGGLVQAQDSMFSNNTGGGIFADKATIDVTSSLITGNGIGIQAQDTATIRIGNSTITGNTTLLSGSGGTTASYGDNYFGGPVSGLTPVSKQ